jgi:hypothetical protein
LRGLRYSEGVTGLLEKALNRVRALSEKEQDSIAAQILETLDDEEAWERNFRANADAFRRMGDEALEEHRRGETRPLENLLLRVAEPAQ